MDWITVRNVALTSCFQAPEQSSWMSGFVRKSDHELFSPRRRIALFGVHCDPFPELPTGRRIERAYFGGVLFPYYGHFIIESLSFLPNIPNDKVPIVFMTLDNTVTRWQREFFQDAGLAERIVVTERESLMDVGNLIRVDQTTVIRSEISSRYIKYLQRLFPSHPNKGRLLYLSRKTCRNAPVTNEDLLEEGLGKLGFEMVTPELHSIREQVRLYDEAAVIVAIEGSALHTLAFTSTPKAVIVLPRRRRLDLNFSRQFAVQPEIRAIELHCMKRYANSFWDSSEIEPEKAVNAIRTEMDRMAKRDRTARDG